MDEPNIMSKSLKLYPEPPYIYEQAEICSAMFFIEQEKIKPFVPAFLKIPRTPLMNAFIASYHKSAIGTYHEAIVLVQATYKSADGSKVDGFYCPFIFVDTDVALTCGREIWGFPKRLANISFIKTDTEVTGIVTRQDKDILKINVKLQTSVPDYPSAKILTLKQIPKPDTPGLAITELIETDFQITPSEIMTGSLSISCQESEEDPLYQLVPKSLIQGTYLVADMTIPYGHILHQFSE
jgi:acetoacetate decarboxylase